MAAARDASGANQRRKKAFAIAFGNVNTRQKAIKIIRPISDDLGSSQTISADRADNIRSVSAKQRKKETLRYRIREFINKF